MSAVGTKVRIPQPRRTLVERSRLQNPFGAVPRPRLVLLSAPPGFGKTTLLTQWLTQSLTPLPDPPESPSAGSHPRVGWVSLDESDTDVRTFLADLIESVGTAGGEPGTRTRALLQSERTTAVTEVLASLIDDLDALAGTTVLALDDFHRAGSPEVHQAVSYLVENLPPGVILAITTRADPPLRLSRLRTRDELVEIRAADLRLSGAECEAFLRTVMGLELATNQVDALLARTEGWVAGLQLAALSTQARTASGPAAVDGFITAFSGSHRFVVDYLVEEVLDAQSPEVRDFLLLTSILQQLTGPLCDALSGGSDGRHRLERLESGNLFVAALDDERRWFRYHQLFAEALRVRLAVEHPDREPSLHLAASRWYAAQGLLDDALGHAAHAGDADWLADLVEYALPGMRSRRRDRTLAQWTRAVPDVVASRRPILATARAWTWLADGDLEAAGQWLDRAQAALIHTQVEDRSATDRAVGVADEPPPVEPEPDQRVPDAVAADWRDQTRTARATIAIYRAALAQAVDDPQETVRQARLARDSATERDHFVQGAASGFLGLAAWAAGDLGTAIATFRGAVDHLGAAGNVTDQLGATVVLAGMALANGQPGEARRLYERALGAAEQRPAEAASIIGDLHVGLAAMLREHDELAAAARQLEIAQELGDTASLPENRFRRHAVTARLLLAGRDVEAALEQLRLAELLYRPGFFPDTTPLPATAARILIAGGRLDQARRWAGGRAISTSDPAVYLNEYDLLTYARLVIAEDRAGRSGSGAELSRATLLLESVIGAATDAGRLGSQVEARMVLALALYRQGERRRAREALRRALLDGVPAGYRRLFLDEAGPMEQLLKGLLTAPGESDRATELARLLIERGPAPSEVFRLAAVADEPLSERELVVVRLLASDLSGPEIAGRLFVSINTLRTHTKHIFTKLDVRTRRAAVTRARELQLL